MAVNPYATEADLVAYIGDSAPVDATRLLARAQQLVDDALTSAVYTSDANGNPTDATVLAALKTAVCAQVEWWTASGDELGQLDRYSSWSIEGISVTRASGSGQMQQDICDRARAALRAAGLIPGTVVTT